MNAVTHAERVAAWRVEIEQELLENAVQLAHGRAELERAEAVHAEAMSSWLALQRFVRSPLGKVQAEFLGQPIDVSEDLASALHSRLQGARDDGVRKAEGPRGKARAALKEFERRRVALLDALSQIDRILNADGRAVDKHRSPAVASPNTPKRLGFGGAILADPQAIVAYDNIEMPAV